MFKNVVNAWQGSKCEVFTADRTDHNVRHQPERSSPTKWVSSSVWSLDQLDRREDVRDDLAQILNQSFLLEPLRAVLAWAGMSTLWCCQSSIFSADHGVTYSPGCHEGWFWRGCRGMWHARTMQSSLDSCKKRFLWTHKEVELAPHAHPIIGLVLQVGDAEKFPQALGFQSLGLSFRVI